MPDKTQDNPLPGGSPPDATKIDPAAQRATEKNEQAALDRIPEGQLVPNVPGIGITESQAAGAERPAGEDRPSVEIPTHAPPEQAGPLIGVNVADRPPQQGRVYEKALAAEQRIAWFIQHQPFPVPGGLGSLQALHARLHAARYREGSEDEIKGLTEQAGLLFDTHKIPDHTEN